MRITTTYLFNEHFLFGLRTRPQFLQLEHSRVADQRADVPNHFLEMRIHVAHLQSQNLKHMQRGYFF